MDGQMSLFDYDEPEIVPEYAIRVFFGDGFSITREFDKPYVGMWDDLIQKHGMIVNYEFIRDGKQEKKLRSPCFLACEVEWCSLACYLKRGYIRHDGKWVRNDKGEILISNKKECEWKPRES